MPGDVRAGPAGFGAAVGSVARRAIATRARLVIIGVTVFLGLAVPVLMAVAGDPADRTFATVTSATLSLVSIPLPFLGALLAVDLHRTGGDSARVGPLLWPPS